jgi:hypothetical protein
MTYIVVSAYTTNDLMKKVNDHLTNGWTLLGQPFLEQKIVPVTTNSHNAKSITEYHQAMTKSA